MTTCNSCTVIPTGGTTPTNSSSVTYDGSALSCIPFSSGTLNQLASALNAAICILQSTISALGTVDSDNVILDNINVNCLGLTDGDTLTQALNQILIDYCALSASINALNTDDLDTIHLTTNCVGLTNGMTLTEAIDAITEFICDFLGSGFVTGDEVVYSKDQRSTYKHPIGDYVKSTMTCSDTSGDGVAKVTFRALDYFVNNTNVSKISEQIPLADTADNYIFLDNTDDFNYNVSSVAIGAAAPTTAGVDVVVVRTGTGSVTSITTLIQRYPIVASFIADAAIIARHLNSAIVGLGIELNSGTNVLDVKYDNSTIGINGSNQIYVKPDGITKTEINADIAGNGLGQNVSGALEVNVAKSITIASDAVQLDGDATSPGNFKKYATNSSGAKGWQQDLCTATLTIDHADILTLNTTPIELIPAPGAGYAVHMSAATIETKNWTTPYATNTDLLIRTDTATTAQSAITTYSPLLASVDRIGRGISVVNLSPTDTQIIENKGVYVSVDTGNPTAGTAGQQLIIRVTYEILSV